MQYPNKKQIAYYASLALFFSYIELMLPRFLPFMKVGLSNIAILLSLNLPFSSFLLLTLLKSIITSFVSGTLLSPFLLISLAQSFASALFMYGLFKIKGKWISIYGISILGSALSALVQLYMASFYLTEGTFKLSGPMLFFSAFSGLITAFFSRLLKMEDGCPSLIYKNEKEICQRKNKNSKKSSDTFYNIFTAVSIFISSAIVFYEKNIYLLLSCMIFSFLFQILSGRKVKILPHVMMWIFIFLVSLFSFEGKVLFSIGRFSITQGALKEALEKSLKLSSAMALSQCAWNLTFKEDSILQMSMNYYFALQAFYKKENGNLLKKIQACLCAKNLEVDLKEKKKGKKVISFFMVFLYGGIFIAGFLL